jgi:zinc transporter ZupT
MTIVLALIASLSDVLGGLLPFWRGFKRFSTRYVLAFAAGTVTSAAFFELLPESNLETNWWLAGLGFFLLYLVDKGLALHQCEEEECELSGVSWITVLGMALDNIIDGAGIAVAYLASPPVGIVVTLAVVAHEVPQGVATTLIMKARGYRLRRILLVLGLAGVMYPLGAAVGNLIPPAFQEAALAFVAGVFLYTGASALMHEAHRRFNRWVIVCLMAGAAIALGLKFIE